MHKASLTLTCIFIASLMHGCATYKPVPDGYAGAVAVISDTGFSENGSKGQVFVLMEVDGNPIENSFGASARASYGQGFALTPKFVSRPIPARPMKVKIKAGHSTGAPIHAIASQLAGTFFSVEGITDFTPLSGGEYLVKGNLTKEGSVVWIEDARTGQLMTEKLTGK